MTKYLMFSPGAGQRVDPLMPGLIEEARKSQKDIFLLWNDHAIRITPESTPESIWADYREKCKQESEANLMRGIRTLIGRTDAWNDGFRDFVKNHTP